MAILAALLASCQSTSVGSGSSSSLAETGSTPPATEKFGKGSTRVSLILNRTSNGTKTQSGSNYRNGAVLALTDLGEEEINLVILDGQGSPQKVRQLAVEESSSGSKLIIFPGDAATVSSMASLGAGKYPPLVSLGTTRGWGIYSFTPGAADSIAAGIRFAAVKRRNKVFLIAPPSITSSLTTRIKRRLGKSTVISGVGGYSDTQSGSGFLRRHARALNSANIIAIAGQGKAVVDIVTAIKENPKYASLPLVGPESWSSTMVRNSTFQGAIVATRDMSGMSLIRNKYQQNFSRGITAESAHAYDLIAMASGLVRARGADGLTPTLIQMPTGFRGTTGLFRFNSKEEVERLYQISVIDGGKLNSVQDSPAGF